MYYSYNDDNLMNAILNGSYLGHTDNHSIFINAPLNIILQILYSIAGFIPWYPIMLILAIIIPVIILIYNERKSKRLLMFVAILLPTMIPALLGLTFTTTSAMLAIMAISSFMLREEDFVFPAVCMSLCYCFREEIFFVSCAFILVAYIYRLTEKKWKPVIKNFSLTTFLFLLLWGLTASMYSNAEWQNYKDFNAKRVQTYDYTWYVPYENAPELYEKYGVTYAQYLLVENYDISLESADWSEILSNIQKINIDYYGDYSIEAQIKRDVILTLRVGFYRARHMYADNFWPYGALVLLLYVCAFIGVIFSKQWLRLLPIFCLLLGRNFIWMYLLLKGRFPDRIYISICGLECILLAAMAINLFSTVKFKKERIRQIINIAIAISCAAVGIVQGCIVISTNIQHSNTEKDYEKLYAYIAEHEESTYLLDVRTMLGDTGKLFDTDTTQDNYFQLGGWISESPLMYERIHQLVEENNLYETLGKSNYDATDILLYGNNVYFVVSEERGTEWMNDYLASRNSESSLMIVDIVAGDNETYLICKATIK